MGRWCSLLYSDDSVKLPVEHQITDVGSVQPGMRAGHSGTGTAIGADHVIFHSRDAQYAAGLTLAQAKQYGVLIYQREDYSGRSRRPYRLITPGSAICAPMSKASPSPHWRDRSPSPGVMRR